MRASIPIYSIALPEYNLREEPDYLAVGAKLERLIEDHFPGRRIAIRGISLFDHPRQTRESLTETILTLGTDRYDPQRPGVNYPAFDTETFYALPCEVSPSGGLTSSHCEKNVMADILGDFYTGPPIDRGYTTGLRLDILLLYDTDQLVGIVEYYDDIPDPKDPCLFRFKDAARKTEALIGIVQILP